MAIARLDIELVARLAKLESGLNEAARHLDKLASKAQGAGASIRNSFAGNLLADFAQELAGLLTRLPGQIINGVDALNDLKDATGSSIENISALEDVALRTGTAYEAMSGSLVKLNQVLKDADPGSQQAAVLEAIGLRAEELRAIDPAEALLEVAKALSQFEDDGNKARIVQELFGKSIQEVAPFLKDLADKGRLVATVTTEQAEAAEAFNKEMANLRKNALDFSRSLLGDLVPALNRTLESIRAFGGFGGAIADRLGFSEQGKLTTQAAAISAAMDRTTASIERMQEELNRKGGSDQFLEARIRSARVRLKALDSEAAEVSARLRGVADKLAPPDDSHDKLEAARLSRGKRSVGGVPDKSAKTPKERLIEGLPVDRIEAFRQSELAANAAVNEALAQAQAADAAEARAYAQKLLAEQTDATSEAQQRLNDRLQAMLDASPSAELERTRDDMLLLADAFEKGSITAEQFSEAAQTKLGTLPEKFKDSTDKMTVFAEEAARNIQDALGDTILQAMDGDFDSIGESWKRMLNRMVSEALAADIGNALFPGGKPSFMGALNQSSGQGDNGLVDLLGSIGTFFGAENPSSSFAVNGSDFGFDFAAALPSYDVGTAFVPEDQIAKVHKGERIITAAQNRSGEWGGTVIHNNPSIYIDGRLDQAATAQLINQALAANNRAWEERMAAQGRR